jgi:hypothetical protein
MSAGLGGTSVLFAIAAAFFLYSGLSMPTTIHDGTSEVANLQLMHTQSLNIAIAIGAAIVSAILAVGSAIVGAISEPPA